MIIFNIIGLAYGAAAFSVGVTLFSVGVPGWIAAIVTGVLVGGADFVFRLGSGPEKMRVVQPSAGGQCMFVPMWLWGIALAVMGVAWRLDL